MATNFASMQNTASRFPIGQFFPLPSGANRTSVTESKKTGSIPPKVLSFDPQVLSNVLDGKPTRECLTDDFIFSQGDSADAVFYIQSGKVKLTVVSPRGKEAVIAYLPECSFFGEGALAGQPVRVSAASALEPCIVIRIENVVMLDLLQREPGFSEQFLGHVLSRNIRMEADLVDHLFNSSEKRLARLLLMMANFNEDSKPVASIGRINQETLAEMIGTTRSRVSFFLNRFRDLGFINYSGNGMHINSSLANVVLQD